MFGQTLAIARNTFIESIRQPIYFVLIMACGLMQAFNVLLSAYSMGYTEKTEVSGDDKLLLDMGLATVLACATLVAAFVATSVLSREIENKTALTVISKPIGRPVFVLGKYLGVTGAVLMSVLIMLLFFLFAIRHAVMSTARDTVDGPVLIFGGLAILFSLGLAVWGNFFYGWVFSSTATATMLPALLIAYCVTLFVDKEWHWQPFMKDIKPQILIAAACVGLAMMVLTSVAIAASTKLGQVMTVVVCAGVFMLGLFSNHLLGRYAFSNHQVAVIKSVELLTEDATLRSAGETAKVTLRSTPRRGIGAGTSFYYGPDPSGVAMAVPSHRAFTGSVSKDADIMRPPSGPAMIVRNAGAENVYDIVNAGGIAVQRPPRENDFVFTEPTKVNVAARAAWSVVPNMQFFWMVDAVTQGHKITGRYLALAGGYAAAQITGFLALAVFLFQKRDVG